MPFRFSVEKSRMVFQTRTFDHISYDIPTKPFIAFFKISNNLECVRSTKCVEIIQEFRFLFNRGSIRRKFIQNTYYFMPSFFNLRFFIIILTVS